MKNSRQLSLINSLANIGLIKTMITVINLLAIKYGLKKHITAKNQKIFLRRNTSDIACYRQIFIDGDYDISFPFEPKVIVDLGANIGLFTIIMRGKFKNSTIIAVEPEPSNFKQLKKNTTKLGNVKLYNNAIWPHSGDLFIETTSELGEWGATTTTSPSNQKIQALTISELMQKESINLIDVMKIDIEGAEENLFENGDIWIERVRMLIIELHDWKSPGSSNSFFRTIAKLNNFSVLNHGENFVIINNTLI